jgi:hypothetical protein
LENACCTFEIESMTLAGSIVMNPLSARALADSAASRIPKAAMVLFIFSASERRRPSAERAGENKKTRRAGPRAALSWRPGFGPGVESP